MLIPIALIVFTLVQCVQADPARVRGLSRGLWALVIIVLPMVGSLAWIVAGRPLTEADGGTGRARRRPVAPDDDLEFLASLGAAAVRDLPHPPAAAPADPPVASDHAQDPDPAEDAADGSTDPNPGSGPSGTGPDPTGTGDARA